MASEQQQAFSLHEAARSGDEQAVAGLIIAGGTEIDIDAEDSDGFTPFALAARKGHVGVMRALLEAGADPRQDFEFALNCASFDGNLDVTRLLLDRGAVVNTPGQLSALHWASFRGNVDVARLLLDRGAAVNDVDDRDGTSLHLACESGASLAVVELLLERGADVTAWDDRSETPLMVAASSKGNDSTAIVERLVSIDGSGGVHAKVRGVTLLAWAVVNGRAETAELLLRLGARIEDNESLLSEACSNSRLDKVEMLVSHGADVTWKDRWGRTALHEICRVRPRPLWLETIRFLLDSGADANAADDRGDTPLHLLLRFQREGEEEREQVREAARLLLDRGADAGAANLVGETPLLQAVMGRHVAHDQDGDERMMEVLLEGKMDLLPSYDDDDDDDDDTYNK